MTFRLPSELLDAVDKARGDVPRTKFVERALEKALGAPRIVREPDHGSVDVTAWSDGVGEDVKPPRAPETDLPKIAKRHWS